MRPEEEAFRCEGVARGGLAFQGRWRVMISQSMTPARIREHQRQGQLIGEPNRGLSGRPTGRVSINREDLRWRGGGLAGWKDER